MKTNLTPRKFTHKEDLFLFYNHLQHPIKRISDMMGRSDTVAGQRMKLLGIVIPSEIVELNKQESYFKKGHKSWNKGKKGIHFKGSEKGWFKKGNDSQKYDEHSISIRIDKTGRLYQWYREAKSKWRMAHCILWEFYNGKIPTGHIIVFKNKDSMDIRIENLEMITLKENMNRNSIQNYHPEIKQTIRLLSKLKKTIKNHGAE